MQMAALWCWIVLLIVYFADHVFLRVRVKQVLPFLFFPFSNTVNYKKSSSRLQNDFYFFFFLILEKNALLMLEAVLC